MVYLFFPAFSLMKDSDFLLQHYFKEVSKYPLIAAKREVELAALIKKGNQEAYRELICANLRLVVKIARKYANYGLSVPDLIAEGNIGLMKAAMRFDLTKKIKFSTNAS